MGPSPANSALDLPFVVVEVVGLLALVGVVVFGPGARRARIYGAYGVALLLSPGLAVLWHLVLPPTSGIEGAGRFVVGAPLNGAVVVATAALLARAGYIAGERRFGGLALFALHAGLTTLWWVWFLFFD